jgi:hypothetical protein
MTKAGNFAYVQVRKKITKVKPSHRIRPLRLLRQRFVLCGDGKPCCRARGASVMSWSLLWALIIGGMIGATFGVLITTAFQINKPDA